MNMMKLQDELEESYVPAFIPAEDEDRRSDGRPVQAGAAHRSLPRFQWFADRPLRAKINLIFGAFAAAALSVCAVLALGLGDSFMRFRSSGEVQRAITTTNELRTIVGETRYLGSSYYHSQNRQMLGAKQAAGREAAAAFDRIETALAEHAPQFEPKFARLRATYTRYDQAFDRTMAIRSSEGQTASSRALAIATADIGDDLYRDIKLFADELATFNEAQTASNVRNALTVIAMAAVLAALGAILLVAGFAYISRDLVAKIGEITQGMTRLAGGDRDISIAGTGRKDEIGEMLRALGMFKRANRQLERWARERAASAEREIRDQQERERERLEAEERRARLLSDVATSFEKTVGEVVDGVTRASGELHGTAAQMASTAQQASHQTQRLSETMAEANSGATAAAAASDEFAMSISEISRQAASSSQLARLATDATQEADSTISALSSSADQIGAIVELIQTIAQRTNLLALNASIEAARGGEAGRGFAVVASEVKELANQTSRATQEIADQIRAMQDTTGASVSALRAIAGQVRELEGTAIAIASAVDQQAVAGQELARSIDLAAHGTQEVAGHLGEVRLLSESTGESARDVLGSANALERQAAVLNKQVEGFLKQIRSGQSG